MRKLAVGYIMVLISVDHFIYFTKKMAQPAPSKLMMRHLRYGALITNAYDKYPILSKVYYCLRYLNLPLCLFCAYHYAIYGEGTYSDKMQAVQFTISIVHILPKPIVIGYGADNVFWIIKEVDDLWNALYYSEENREIMQRTSKTINLFVKIIIGSFMAVNLIFGLPSIVSHAFFETMWKPLQLYVYFENFWIASFAQLTIYSLCAFSYCGFLTLYAALSLHLTGFLMILRKTYVTDRAKPKDIYILHQRIIKLIDRTNQALSGLMFFEMICSSLQSACTGYAVIQAFTNNDLKWIGHFFVFMMSFGVAFNACIGGSLISAEAEKLHIDLYQNKWYETNIKTRKELVIVSTVATRRRVFHFMGVIHFDMELFATFIRGTYAYLSALNVLSNKGVV